MSSVELQVLDAEAAAAEAGELGKVLADCVAGGASVNFMHPYTPRDGEAFFAKVAGQVARGETLLIAARQDGRIVGTVQIGLDTPPNQPHRADVKKMLVHRSARRKGLGAALLAEAERSAAALGKTLLVLDTVEGGAGERLYESQGWVRVGTIPDYALYPDGRPCATVVFYKRLSA
jgi:GNAT superfamily N-acetyltransferase